MYSYIQYGQPIPDKMSRDPNNIISLSSTKNYGRQIPTLMFLCIEKTYEKEKHKMMCLAQNDHNISKQLELYLEKQKFATKIEKYGHFVNLRSSVFVYGGYIRDKIGGYNWRDINMVFYCDNEYKNFLIKMRKYKILVLNNYFNNTYMARRTFYVQHGEHPEIEILVDAIYLEPEAEFYYDFDVNVLIMKDKKYTDALYVSDFGVVTVGDSMYREYFNDIIRHIIRREFVVMAKNKKYLIEHRKEQMCYWSILDDNGDIVDYVENKLCPENCNIEHNHKFGMDECSMHIYKMDECIHRGTLHGKKIIQRIKMMEDRGWKCLNKCCTNPVCILAPDELFKTFIKIMKAKCLIDEETFNREFGLKEFSIEKKH